MKVALIRGPFLRPNGVLPWVQLNRRDGYDVVAFESDPPRFDTSDLDLPVRSLSWPDGRGLAGYRIRDALGRLNLPNIYLRGLRSVAAEFDALHVSENYHLFGFVAALLADADTNLVVTCGENIPYPLFQRAPVRWWMKRVVNRTAAAFTTTTPAGRTALVHEGVAFDDVTVVPNAIDADRFHPSETPRDSDRPTVLFAHGLTEQKGVPWLLEAFDRVEGADLHLLGRDELGVELPADVRHTEWVEPADMPAVYRSSDVFVLPSVTMCNNAEQFGMAALEAMACGLPAVVTDVGGLPYLVDDGETGTVVPERDAGALADSLQALVDDPRLRARYGERARAVARERYSPARTADILEEVYAPLS